MPIVSDVLGTVFKRSERKMGELEIGDQIKTIQDRPSYI